MTVPWVTIERLADPAQVASFECSREDVTRWLVDKAWASRHLVATHVCIDDAGSVRAFFALKTIVVPTDGLSSTQASGAVNGYLTGVLLCWMAVHVEDEGQGLGRAVLREAMLAAASAYEVSPFQLMVIDAASSELVGFYERAGFRAIPNTLRLVAPMKSVRKALSG